MSDDRKPMFEDGEVLDGVPVLAAETQGLEPRRLPGALSPVAIQTAAVVGVSVLAGATAVTFAHKRKARRTVKRDRRQRILAPVLASRSFLVEVHMLGERK